jgi:hypothetical protein
MKTDYRSLPIRDDHSAALQRAWDRLVTDQLQSLSGSTRLLKHVADENLEC